LSEHDRAMKAGTGLATLTGVVGIVGGYLVLREAHRGTEAVYVALVALVVVVSMLMMGAASKRAHQVGAWLARPPAPAPGPGVPAAWPEANDPVLQAAADTDAVAALVQLGFSTKVADAAIAKARRQGLVPEGADAGQVVAAALRTSR